MSFPETVVLTYDEVKTAGTSTQRCPLGTRGVLPDGRVYRYARAGSSNIAIGQLCTSEAPAGNYYATSGGVTISATTVTTTWNYIDIESSHQADTTAETADTYAEGYMLDPSDGSLVRIKSHTGHTASSTEHTRFTFEDGDHLPVTITGTDQCMMVVKNPYDDVIIAGAVAGAGACALGYTNATITATYYFWLQTWGPVGAELEGTHAVGLPMVHSTETATAISSVLTTDHRICAKAGTLMSTAADTTYGMLMCQISP